MVSYSESMQSKTDKRKDLWWCLLPSLHGKWGRSSVETRCRFSGGTFQWYLLKNSPSSGFWLPCEMSQGRSLETWYPSLLLEASHWSTLRLACTKTPGSWKESRCSAETPLFTQPFRLFVFFFRFLLSVISYEWNYVVCLLLSLASFVQHNAFEMHPCCWVF